MQAVFKSCELSTWSYYQENRTDESVAPVGREGLLTASGGGYLITKGTL